MTPPQSKDLKGSFISKFRVIWHKAGGEMYPSIWNQDGFTQAVKGVSLWKLYHLKKISFNLLQIQPIKFPCKEGL
jgi:hypothetical protein